MMSFAGKCQQMTASVFHVRGLVKQAVTERQRLVTSQDECAGMTFADMYGPEALERSRREILPTLQKGGTWAGETTVRAPPRACTPTFARSYQVPAENGSML